MVIDQKPNLDDPVKVSNFDWNNQYNNYSENYNQIHKKDTFYQIMENYDNYQKKFYNYGIKNFIPKTIILKFSKYKDTYGIDLFLDLNDEISASKKWIYKPSFSSQGQGIFIFNSLKEAQQFVIQTQQDLLKDETKDTIKGIIQHYIDNTALFKNRKFDIRCYLLFSSFDVDSELVFYNEGVVRTSSHEYKKEDEINQDNRTTHLTNCAVQLNQDGEVNKNTITQTFQSLQQYTINQHGFTQQQADNIKIKIKQILTFVAEAYLNSIPNSKRKQGQFQHFGVDIMLDDQFNPYILEVNSGPVMKLGATAYDQAAKDFLKSMMDLQTYLIENQDYRQRIIKEKTYPQGNLELLINRKDNYNFLSEQLELKKKDMNYSTDL